MARLPKSERYRNDGYEAYGWLPTGSREAGKGSEVSRNDGMRSASKGKPNGLGRSVEAYSKSAETLVGSLAMAWLREGWI